MFSKIELVCDEPIKKKNRIYFLESRYFHLHRFIFCLINERIIRVFFPQLIFRRKGGYSHLSTAKKLLKASCFKSFLNKHLCNDVCRNWIREHLCSLAFLEGGSFSWSDNDATNRGWIRRLFDFVRDSACTTGTEDAEIFFVCSTSCFCFPSKMSKYNGNIEKINLFLPK